MDNESDDERPSAHARLNISLGRMLPSFEAEAGVKGRETRPFVRLLIFATTIAAVIVTGLLSSLMPGWLLVLLVVVELAGGAFVLFRSW